MPAAGAKGVSASGSGFASMAGVKGMMGGIAHGTASGASAAMMSDSAVGMGTLGSGAGSPFADQGRTFLGNAGGGPGGGFDPYQSAKSRGDLAASTVGSTVVDKSAIGNAGGDGGVGGAGGAGGTGGNTGSPFGQGQRAPFGDGPDMSSRSSAGGSGGGVGAGPGTGPMSSGSQPINLRVEINDLNTGHTSSTIS